MFALLDRNSPHATLSLLGAGVPSPVGGTITPTKPSAAPMVYAQGNQFVVSVIGGGPFFKIYISTDSETWTLVSGPTDSRVYYSDTFNPGTARYFRVTACLSDGSGETDPTDSRGNAILTVPTGLNVTPSDGAFSVSWTNTGGTVRIFKGSEDLGTATGSNAGPFSATNFEDFQVTLRSEVDINNWSSTCSPVNSYATFGPITVSGTGGISQPIETQLNNNGSGVPNFFWGLSGTILDSTTIIDPNTGNGLIWSNGSNCWMDGDGNINAVSIAANANVIIVSLPGSFTLWNGKPF